MSDAPARYRSRFCLLLLRDAPAQLFGALAYPLAEAEDAGEVAAGLRGLLKVDHVGLLEDRVPGEAVHQRVEPRDGRPQGLRRLYLRGPPLLPVRLHFGEREVRLQARGALPDLGRLPPDARVIESDLRVGRARERVVHELQLLELLRHF